MTGRVRCARPMLNSLGNYSPASRFDGKILDVYQEGDDFVLVEGCDEYFSITLSAAELAQLGRELIDISGEKP